MDAIDKSITINVLWTGGLDSTFRICELSRHNVVIQPYYIVEERKSEPYERRSITWITQYLRNRETTKATLLDTKFIDWNSFKTDNEIASSWNNLRQTYRIGSQYEYIAKFAKQYNLILEVGLERSPRSKAYNALNSEGGLVITSPIAGIEQYTLNLENCSSDIKRIFGNLRFHKLLFEISKIEEVNFLEKWGLKDVVKHTWFCHNPVLGLPCGRCNPCRDALNEGFAWRVPTYGRIFGFLRGCRNVALRNIKRLF